MTVDAVMPFWLRPLDVLTREEWEQLCDGCGRCCLHKLEDEDSGEVYYTRVACSHLDIATCRCTAYERRSEVEPECMVITQDNLSELDYLPETCAYRLRKSGRPLPPWHHLISGSTLTLHAEGVSVQSYALRQELVPDPDDLEDFIIEPP